VFNPLADVFHNLCKLPLSLNFTHRTSHGAVDDGDVLAYDSEAVQSLK
jgi:hypothetical protein